MRNDRLPPVIQIPSFGLDHPKAKAVAAKYVGVLEQHAVVMTRLSQLEEERAAAVVRDRQALADAKRAGKPDPGDQEVVKVDAELVGARREAEGMQVAVLDQHAEFVAVVDSVQTDWLGRLDKRLDEKHAALQTAIDTVVAARTDLVAVYQERAWLDQFPDRTGVLKEPVSLARPGARADVRGRNGDPLPWAQVEQLLRAMAERPVAKVSEDPGDQRIWRPSNAALLG